MYARTIAVLSALLGAACPQSAERRVILAPGRWKIKTSQGSEYVSYTFHLSANATLRLASLDYPSCEEAACAGLEANRTGCGRLCLSGMWRSTELAGITAAKDYERARDDLRASFAFLTDLARSELEPASSLSRGSLDVDVLLRLRADLGEAREETLRHVAPPSRLLEVKSLGARMESWRSGTLSLIALLNSGTFAMMRTREVLLSCAQGIAREDMTGCLPGLAPALYADVPVGYRATASGRLSLKVRRDAWRPVSLSRWYLPFTDAATGNRTCWLDRGMVNDSRSNYREPNCDARGICDELRADAETLGACDPGSFGEVGPECPLTCESACFGPVCYDESSGSYASRVAERPELPLLVSSRPRRLVGAHSVSEDKLFASLERIEARGRDALDSLERAASVSESLDGARRSLKETEDALRESELAWARETKACEDAASRGSSAALAALAISSVACSLLVFVALKTQC